MKNLQVFPDSGTLARGAAEQFVKLAVKAIAQRGRFAVALSGGSTPRKMYSILASKEFSSRLAWEYVHVFWGDERCVPPDHRDSNFGMFRKTLLKHVPLPPDNIHRIRGEIAPKEAAKNYERELQSFFIMHIKKRGIKYGDFVPSFDLIFLGLGEDGHTASLFPGTAALRARRRWVIANQVDLLDTWRITLTSVIINVAAQVTFVVSGRKKANPLQQVLYGSYLPRLLPAQLIKPGKGRLLWMVDEAAAAML
jgi:6-phosphogluconolactonase